MAKELVYVVAEISLKKIKKEELLDFVGENDPANLIMVCSGFPGKKERAELMRKLEHRIALTAKKVPEKIYFIQKTE